jgi:hypothetical protein
MGAGVWSGAIAVGPQGVVMLLMMSLLFECGQQALKQCRRQADYKGTAPAA